MGCSDTYCCFCSGPLDNAREAWIDFLKEGITSWPPKDGEWHNPPGYPVPDQPIEEIVTIDEEDGAIWDDWVVVSPLWAEQDWVSPSCTVDSYGVVAVNGDTRWNQERIRFLIIHRICLSFLCRRLAVSPKTVWESCYAPESDYRHYGGGQGLLHCVQYYDMENRNGQFFSYVVGRSLSRADSPDEMWYCYDLESMTDTAWILSRPNILPQPKPLALAPVFEELASGPRLFDVPELLDAVLVEIMSVSSDDIVREERDNAVRDSPSVTAVVRTILSLSLVNRWFYRAIIHDRQGLFVRLASTFGWMLPCTPADWSNWPSELTPLSFSLTQPYDWREYLLTCLRKENPHVRNRWRFHRMTIQFARGRTGKGTFRWSVGKLGVPSDLDEPKPELWELGSEGQVDNKHLT
ncbi:hypothetical protein E1B28_007055 [Marasmius oreades]|uniref:Uncharacterized protein n=1 Tax=Marasmius oreades TaxID=181124 RepID=A0A9P7S148_9AGAR|nr:uncharacterized protein E1B28_007055 [Marasmius oreades]KAG7093375.1 hypothetical protein E1B28_007055 [Marasmius oreades]